MKGLDKLVAKLSKADLAKAQKSATEWLDQVAVSGSGRL